MLMAIWKAILLLLFIVFAATFIEGLWRIWKK